MKCFKLLLSLFFLVSLVGAKQIGTFELSVKDNKALDCLEISYPKNPNVIIIPLVFGMTVDACDKAGNCIRLF